MTKKPSWQRRFTWKTARGLRRLVGGRRAGFMHAQADGAPVLIDKSNWRTVNGVFINTRWGYASFIFRRMPK